MTCNSILLSDGVSVILLADGVSELVLDSTFSDTSCIETSSATTGAGRRGIRQRRYKDVQLYENIRLPVKSNIQYIQKINTSSSIAFKIKTYVKSLLDIKYTIPTNSRVLSYYDSNISVSSNIIFHEKVPIKGIISFGEKLPSVSRLLYDNYKFLFADAKRLIDDIDSL